MIAYLDNSATTRPTAAVVAAMERCMREGYFNPSSLYAPALHSEKAMDDARACIRTAIHAPTGTRVVFVSGGTEGNNLAVIGAVSAMHGPQRVAVSAVEHPSVKEAFAALAAQGHEVVTIGVDRRGELDYAQLEAELEKGLTLVSCMQVNNETGAVTDIARLSGLVRRLAPDALIHVDGVQGFMRVPFDMRKVDLYTLSAHKIRGPKGIGALVAGARVRLAPRQIGGGQEAGVRSGTENTPGIAGLAAAIGEMAALGDVDARLREQKMRLLDAMRAAVPEVLVNGPAPEAAAGHIINLSFPGVRGEVMLHALEGQGVYVSTGSACSSKKRKVSAVLTAMGYDADEAECALRFSLSPDTTAAEINYAAAEAGKLYHQLKMFKRR